MSEHPPRAITPYEKFDVRPKLESQSKIAAAKPTRAPADSFEGLPPIPRAAPLPTGTGFGEVFGGAHRDTDACQLQDAELGDDDETPADPETPYEMILRKLTKVEHGFEDAKKTSHRIINLLNAVRAEQQVDKRERRVMKRRVRALELRDRWVPWVAIVLSALALFHSYR